MCFIKKLILFSLEIIENTHVLLWHIYYFGGSVVQDLTVAKRGTR